MILIFDWRDFTFQYISYSPDREDRRDKNLKALYILALRSSCWEIFLNHLGNLSYFDSAGQEAA